MPKERKLSQGFEEALLEAFPAVTPPAGVTASSTPDCREIDALVSGIPWDQLPAEIVDKLRTDLPLYTSEYFRYVLPAYLLRAYRTEDRSFAFYTIASLQPGSIHEPAFRKFTEQQRKVIKRFLNWAANRLKDRDAEKALAVW